MKRLLLVLSPLALALTVAGCSGLGNDPAGPLLLEPADRQHGLEIQSSHTTPVWDLTSGVSVSITGAGMGSMWSVGANPQTLSISEPASVQKLLVQVVLKGGDPVAGIVFEEPDEVRITTSDGQEMAFAGPGAFTHETEIGRFYQHEFTPLDPGVGISHVTAEVVGTGNGNALTPRSVIGYAFRSADATGLSLGKAPDHDLFGQRDRIEASENFSLPTALAPRDIQVTFAVSDLGSLALVGGTLVNDTRVAVLEATAGSVSVTQSISSPSHSDELLLHSLTLEDVPGDVTSLTATVRSPKTPAGGNPLLYGDSIFWNGVNVDIPVEEQGGGDGCTPGYWRQPHHYDSWVGYSPSDLFDTVFGVDATLNVKGTRGPPKVVTEPTLGEAVQAVGGSANALARHAVAALLNAASPEVDYAYNQAQIISMVQSAFASGDFETAKDSLADQNELGCPLN